MRTVGIRKSGSKISDDFGAVCALWASEKEPLGSRHFQCHTVLVEWGHGKFSHLASIAASQHGVLTFEQLREEGLSPWQIQRRVKGGLLIRRPGRVLVIAGSTDTWHQRVAAAALAAARHARVENGAVGAASHRAAARLHAFRTVDSDVEVSVRYPRQLVVPGATVVRSIDLLTEDVTWVEGVPTTTPERTIVDLGLKFPEHEVMRILRHAIAAGQVSRRDLVVMRCRTSKQGRNGTGVLGRCLEALPEQAEWTESGVEVLFLSVCEDHQLPVPALQLPVRANGRNYRLDFAYPSHRIAIEIDGAPHDEPMRIAKDGGRQNDLVALGWRPVRFTYTQLKREPAFCAHVLRGMLGFFGPQSDGQTRAA